jgi:hypothetical protein
VDTTGREEYWNGENKIEGNQDAVVETGVE